MRLAPLPIWPSRRLSSPSPLSLSTALLLAASACGPLAEDPAATAPAVKRADDLAGAATTVVLEPIADAYASELYPSTNYGASQEFVVAPYWSSGYASQRHEAYLRFDLSGLPANAHVTSVTLRTTAHTGFAWGGDGNVYTFFVPDDSWSESGLTWNNKPAVSGEALGSWWLWYNYSDNRLQEGNHSETALAHQVQTELHGDRTLSLRLHSTGYRTNYRSREYGDSTQRPKLEITYDVPDTCVDSAKPTLVLNGTSDVTLQCGVDTWKEPGAKAWDACGPVEVHYYNSGGDAYGPGPNLTQEGKYQIQYIAWNKAGYTVDTLRSVYVVDKLAPTLKLKGASSVSHTCGSQWQDPGVEARDLCAGDLTSVVTRSGEVNSWAPGVYTLRYDVRDRSGNAAPPVTRTVTVANCPW